MSMNSLRRKMLEHSAPHVFRGGGVSGFGHSGRPSITVEDITYFRPRTAS
jgi:hypothetical protein